MDSEQISPVCSLQQKFKLFYYFLVKSLLSIRSQNCNRAARKVNIFTPLEELCNYVSRNLYSKQILFFEQLHAPWQLQHILEKFKENVPYCPDCPKWPKIENPCGKCGSRSLCVLPCVSSLLPKDGWMSFRRDERQKFAAEFLETKIQPRVQSQARCLVT